MGFFYFWRSFMDVMLDLIKQIAIELKKQRWQLVTAESCTGGLIASAITEVPGSSAWFERGFVTYSNLAKEEMLGVPQELLVQFGAVSVEVAAAMAEGALQHSAGNIALAVTGIAGPDGGSLEKPVGTICFSWAVADGSTHTLKKQFTGSRQEKQKTGLAWVDLSGGRFHPLELHEENQLQAELTRLQPAELLLQESSPLYNQCLNFPLKCRPGWEFNAAHASTLLREQFAVSSLAVFGENEPSSALVAAGALLAYLQATQKQALPHLTTLTLEHTEDYLQLDSATQKHLELFENINGSNSNSLLSLLDKTASTMGSRLLKRWLGRPLKQHRVIETRQRSIQEIIQLQQEAAINQLLRQSSDIERIISRIALKSARPRDLIALRDTLALLPELSNLLTPNNSTLIIQLKSHLQPLPALQELLEIAIVDNPPMLVRDGGVIAPGFDEELDELVALSTNAYDTLNALELAEKQRTGLSTLKFGFNSVQGYYIELSKAQAEKAPVNYHRKQTLKSVERYITPELKTFEEQVLSAQVKALAREKWLYDNLLEELKNNIVELTQRAQALAELDVIATLAERSQSLNWRCPQLTSEPGIIIQSGRHPVIEQLVQERFIANDLNLSPSDNILVITGPNMGGKSTYMRQTALIVLLAHIGSFVPAEHASLGPIDRIFTRIGASDDLTSGRSTFMVEMTETAQILRQATDQSLVLIDEIGRGTSTYDGMALAYASCAYLASKIKAYTLFSTHYFELTHLAQEFDCIRNVHLQASIASGKIIFLYRVMHGPANKSYGLEVAELAGIPGDVLKLAHSYLNNIKDKKQPTVKSLPAQLPPRSALEKELAQIDPDRLSAREALDLIYKLKTMEAADAIN